MLVLAVEIADKGFLLDIEEFDSIISIPQGIACTIEDGKIPDKLIVGSKIKKLVPAGLVNRPKIKLRIGSRILLSKIYPDHAVLIELVRGVVDVENIESSDTVLDNQIYKYLSLKELMEFV